jgi:hypothetical protein
MHWSCHFPYFDHADNVWRGAEITNLILMQLYAASSADIVCLIFHPHIKVQTESLA